MTMAKIGTAMQASATLALACCLALSTVDQAAARDDGVLQFFSSAFGGAGASSNQVAPPDDEVDQPRPGRSLTIRPRSKPRLAVAALPVKPDKVAIFEDRTLRRGDAVMTADGLRIFVGSSSWPHTRDDFVAISKSRLDVSKTTEKVLADLDRRPGG